MSVTFILSSANALNLDQSKILSFGKELTTQSRVLTALTHYHIMPHFDTLKIYIAVENIVRKGEIACNKQFLLFSRFLPSMEIFFHFSRTLKCRLQFLSICTNLKFCR